CDHQIAHVYLNDRSATSPVADALTLPGVSIVRPADRGLSHRRSGDLLLEAAPDAWLDYRWWQSDREAPEVAKLVDSHRNPGYDPLELFFNPAVRGVAQDASRIRGSHGIVDRGEAILVSSAPAGTDAAMLDMTEVAGVLTRLLGG